MNLKAVQALEDRFYRLSYPVDRAFRWKSDMLIITDDPAIPSDCDNMPYVLYTTYAAELSCAFRELMALNITENTSDWFVRSLHRAVVIWMNRMQTVASGPVELCLHLIRNAANFYYYQNRTLYFAYDETMDEATMLSICPDAELAGSNAIYNYRFGIDCNGVPTVRYSPDSAVEGVMWYLGRNDLEKLERYYNCRMIKSCADLYDRTFDNRAAVLLRTGNPFAANYSRYPNAELILEAAKRHDLSPDYINNLRIGLGLPALYRVHTS